MMMGNAVTSRLVDQLNMELTDVMSIDIIVSFIQESGYTEIEGLLYDAHKRDIPVRIITSTYMNITNPTALTQLFYAPTNVQTFIYAGSAPSFHPKAYFFHKKDMKQSVVYVGSSNLSKVALTNGVEWNYRIQGIDDKDALDRYQEEFENILNNYAIELSKEILHDYRKVYQYNRDASKDILRKYYKPKNPDIGKMSKVASGKSYLVERQVESLYKPNSAQIEALLELVNTREEGNEKALVVAATGVGKTFLAAFDSKEYDSILFVAHREEILNQAYETFAKIRGTENLGRFYNGYKEVDKKIVFASVQTLSRVKNLSIFSKDYFEYLCVDELHHGVAKTYEKVIEYFEPKFMLGLTATPHRLDKKDVFAICDYNSVYEVDLFTSINRGWLVPYKYYGIYDATVNYDNVRQLNGKYVDKELEKALMIANRGELIYKHFLRYRRKRALGFCSNIKHAEFMAEFFESKGIACICIHSDSSTKYYCDRKEGIRKLEKGEIDVVFSVDMLSEGVDIPSLDLLLFLRPTESPVVFLQQLGRGLRKNNGKRDVRVLDFIGNFKKVDLIPFLLGTYNSPTGKLTREIQNSDNLPLDCQVDFEFEVVDLIQSVIKSRKKVVDKIQEWFIECQLETDGGKYPTRTEFFNWLDDEQYLLLKKNRMFNPFKDYCMHLSKYSDSMVKKSYFESDEVKFIRFIESTKMAQLYKMPVIQSFITDTGIIDKVSVDDIIDSFIRFYSNNRNRLDILRSKKSRDPKNFSRSDWKRVIISNPVHFLAKTHGDIFELQGEEFVIKLEFNRSGVDKEWFVGQAVDALEFRRSEFLDQRIEG